MVNWGISCKYDKTYHVCMASLFYITKPLSLVLVNIHVYIILSNGFPSFHVMHDMSVYDLCVC